MTIVLMAAGCATSATATPPPSQLPTRIAVGLTDALRMEPATMSVPAGVPVTFVVTNSGTVDHEFFLGDEAAQAEHEQEMQSMGGMAHDEPNGIAVEPGQTEELTFTFAQRGGTLAGCHYVGHYGGGMRASITIE
ncbi:MAG: plastocyanin/azurin family copper-binding protein [Candidatus Limnocylindrales bacterium]